MEFEGGVADENARTNSLCLLAYEKTKGTENETFSTHGMTVTSFCLTQ